MAARVFFVMTVATLGRDCTRADGRRIEGSHRMGKWICRKDGQLLDNSLEIAHHVGLYRSERVDVPKCRYRGADDGLVRIAFVCAVHGMEEA